MPRPSRRAGRSARRPASDEPPSADASARDVKDRLVQTRVPRRLEDVLKAEAKRRRLSVSHLIRNVLEDTLTLVDAVVTGSEQLVDTSVRVAGQVARDAGRLADRARSTATSVKRSDEAAAGTRATPEAERTLDHVLAWNAVVLNRDALCASCSAALSKGSSANLGVSQDPAQPPAWLCSACLARL
jgi:hypothetical protein